MNTSLVLKRADSVWCVHARAPGPHLGFVGGVHGNEQTGIEIVDRLVQKFETGELVLLRGRLSLALGNLRAIVFETRGSEPGQNLNTYFDAHVLTRRYTPYEALRARDLAIALKDVQIGIDLHSTNLPSQPFLVAQSLWTKRGALVAHYLNVPVLLTDPNWVFAGGPSTLDEFFNRGRRRVGICYESGQANDTGRVEEIEAELLDLLRHFKMIAGSPRPIERVPKERYEFVEALIPKQKSFRFVDEAHLANFQTVQAGETIGYDNDRPYIAHHTGVLIFPKPPSLRFVGKPVGYIARRV